MGTLSGGYRLRFVSVRISSHLLQQSGIKGLFVKLMLEHGALLSVEFQASATRATWGSFLCPVDHGWVHWPGCQAQRAELARMHPWACTSPADRDDNTHPSVYLSFLLETWDQSREGQVTYQPEQLTDLSPLLTFLTAWLPVTFPRAGTGASTCMCCHSLLGWHHPGSKGPGLEEAQIQNQCEAESKSPASLSNRQTSGLHGPSGWPGCQSRLPGLGRKHPRACTSTASWQSRLPRCTGSSGCHAASPPAQPRHVQLMQVASEDLWYSMSSGMRCTVCGMLRLPRSFHLCGSALLSSVQ